MSKTTFGFAVDPCSATSITSTELSFHIGHFRWCDEQPLVERLVETAKDGLVYDNAEACSRANCGPFNVTNSNRYKVRNSNLFKLFNLKLMICNSVADEEMNVTWVTDTTYQPISYDDYFYKGSEVSEG